jgi:hypothetical protein
MKKILIILSVLMVFVLTSCMGSDTSTIEQGQQREAINSIITNQPVPDLGGYSFERQIVIETYLARNNTIATYAYMISMDGKIIEICPSIGYPIPYSTQLTNPLRTAGDYYQGSVVANAEPNGLYPPGDAAATLVQCVNPDGSVSPTYIEWYVLAFPYRIVSDFQLQRIGETSFSVDVNK